MNQRWSGLFFSVVFFAIIALLSSCDVQRSSDQEFSGPLPQHSVPTTFSTGWLMWDPGYTDMPYVLKLSDGSLVSTLTVSDGEEGADDQHIILLASNDAGQSWEKRSVIEPPKGPEASWAMPFDHRGRLGVIYTYNTRNVRGWPLKEGGVRPRVDVIGDLAVKFSSDQGFTWSERIVTKLPRTAIDEINGFNQHESVFWLSGAPVTVDGEVSIGLSKSGETRLQNILPVTEAFIAVSSAPFSRDSWLLLPDGAHGLKAPDGSSVAEEPSLIRLETGEYYVVFRTTSGKLAEAIIDEKGQAQKVQWAKHDDGSVVRNPRAKAAVVDLLNDRYLLWFHNNSSQGFENRNPAFVACGRWTDQSMRWGPAKPLISDPDQSVRISYPSILNEHDTLFVTATNKEEARAFRFNRDDICPAD